MASVLIASTDGALRSGLARDLADNGHDTFFAADAMEALRLLKGQSFAAILIDLALAEPGGLSLLARLRAEEPYRYLLAVLIETFPGQAGEAGKQPDSTTPVLCRPIDRRALAGVLAPALVFHQAAQGVPGVSPGADQPGAPAVPWPERVRKLCHDINNPLAVIMGHLEIISGQQQELPGDLSRRIEEMSSAAENLRSLIRQASAEARRDAGGRAR
jgi:CheY-like chemotaxis protein